MNPFPGLRPFTQEEDYLFFGREEQTHELLQRLGGHRFVAVVGTSGSGKSSLVRCGLLSELLGGRMLGAGAAWEIAVTHPGGNPLALLTDALLEAELYDRKAEHARENLQATLSRSHFGLVEAVKQAGLGEGTNFLLVVDQFEEIFRFHETGLRQQEAANEFVSLLLEAAAQKEVPIYVVLTMRSDFIGECGQFEGLAEIVNRGEFLIPRLTREQYKRVVEGPIKVAGGQISPRLLQRLLNDLGQQADQLPCLQHALMRTWDVWAGRGDADALDLDDYERVGKMSQSLSLHADEVFQSLASNRQRALCQGIFQALTVEESNSRGTRRPQRLGRLCQILEVPADELLPIIDAYRQRGVTFLMPSPDVELTESTIIDISHESLMRVWTRLRQWVEEETQASGIYHRLSESAALHERGKAGLYRDPELGIALAWRESKLPNAAWAERYRLGFATAMGFLEASRQASVAEEHSREAARQRELEQSRQLAGTQARVARLFKRFAGGLAVALCLAVALTIWALMLRQEAKRQETAANEQRQVAQEKEKDATAARDVATQTRNAAARQAAGLLLDKGIEDARGGEPARALHVFVLALRTLTADDPEAAPLERVIGANLTAWAETVPALEHIWPGGPRFEDVAFTSDGELIAMAVGKDEVLCCRTDDGRPVGSLIKVPVGLGTAMEFARDARSLWVASPGREKVVEQWAIHRFDPASGLPIQTPIESSGPVDHLTVTPDGRHLVGAVLGLHPDDRGGEADADQTRKWRTASIVVWETATGRVVRKLDVNAESDYATANEWPDAYLSLSSDGKFVAGWVQRGANRFEGMTFTVDGNEPPIGLELPAVGPAAPRKLHFQNNMRTGLAIIDNQLHRWSATEPGLLGPGVPTPFLTMLDGPSADGRSVISAAEGRVFDTGAWPPRPSGERFAHPGWQRSTDASTEQSPDGRFTATWNSQSGGGGRLWRLPRPHSRPSLPPAESARQGERTDDYRHGQLDLRATCAVLWSNRREWGQRADDIHHVRLADVTTGAVRGTSIRHSALVREVVFTPDGRHFATASFDATARVWETATGRPAGPVLKHTNYVATVAFSPDGTILAAGDYGPAGLVKLWDWRTGKNVLPPLAHDDIVLSVSFSPDGSYLAAIKSKDWSKNPELMVWEVASGRAVIRVRYACPSFLLAETARFRPDSRAVMARDVNGVLSLWEVPSGKLLGERPLDGDGVTRFSPNGRVVAAAANLGVRLLDADTLTPLPGGYLPHQDPISDVAFSPDGAFLLTGYESGSAQLWDLATRKPLGQPAVLIGAIRAVTFTPDGKTCVCVAADGAVRRWPLPAPFVEPNLDRLAERLVLMTGQRMDANQGLDSVSADEWRDLRAKLVGDGSTALVPPRPTADWHDEVAADAEQDGDAYGAEWHLDRLAALRTDDWTVLARLGRVLAAAGHRDGAAAAYDKAVRLAASSRDLADWLRAAAAEDEAAKRYGQALWNLDLAVKITPDDWVPYTARAVIEEQAGHTERAEADVDAAVRLGAEASVIVQSVERAVPRATQPADWNRVVTLLTTAARDSTFPIDDRYHLAVACLKAADCNGYRAACGVIAGQMPSAETPLQLGDALAAANAFTLGSGATDEWSIPLSWVDGILTRITVREAADPSQKERLKTLRYLFLHARGALLYRAGQFEDSAKVLREGMSFRPDGGEFHDWLFLALAEHRLDHADAAKVAAAKARAVHAGSKPATVWDKAEVELLASELDAALPPTGI